VENSPEIRIVLKKMVTIQEIWTDFFGFFFCLGTSDFKMCLLRFAVCKPDALRRESMAAADGINLTA
jgi:general stress protein 26